MTVHQIHDGNAISTSTGIIARPVARVVATVDQWDVLLVVGVVMLTVGVWLQWGLGVGLVVGGALLAVGGLYGARGTNAQALESASGPEGSGLG